VRKRWAAWRVDDAWTLGANIDEIGPAQFADREEPAHYVTEEETDELLDGDPAIAEARARKAVAADSSDSQARLLLGAVLRKQKQFAEAKAVLEPLAELMPHSALVWQELGLSLAPLGERAGAINAFLRAIDLRFMDRSAWFWLGDLLEFDSAGSEHPKIGVPGADTRFAQARSAYQEARYSDAESIARELLVDAPDDPTCLRLLADALIRQGRWMEAKPLFERCVEIEPKSHSATFRCATMLFANGHFQLALPHIDELLKHDSGSRLYRGLKAVCLSRKQEYGPALAEFESFIEDCNEQPGLWVEYARLLKVERPDDMMRALERAARILPSCVDVYTTAAFTKSIRLDEAFVEQVRIQAARAGLSYEDSARLHFAAGKAFEDMKRYADSFEQYRLSNDILCTGRAFGIEMSTGYKRRMKRFFKPRFMRARAGWGSPAPDPIFIVGMPRAGSTLVEQILSTHSMIEGLGELPDLGEIIRQTAPEKGDRGGLPYPIALRELDASRVRSLGEQYLERTRRGRKSDKPYFTDKMPGNHNHVAFIHLALPNAKIIDARRNPLDCCFSCFKHYFPAGQPISTNLRDVGRGYVDYVELMAFYDELLPGRVHRVIYEQLVEDPEREVRRLFEYVGLPFEEQCLRFHENKRVAKTISQDQVRMPLYKTGVEQWRNYEPWLGPLKEELGYVLDLYPAVPKYFMEIHAKWTEPLALGQGANPFATVKGVRQMPFEIVARADANLAA
jgi:tetratricopeptide (TPR) repeat protein